MRVILFGFDGLRPDLVGPATTPHLARLIAEGTLVEAARSVLPSETRAALPSIITGCRPGAHGLVANTLFDAALDPVETVNTKEAATLARIGEAAGRVLDRPSLGARLAAAGKRVAVIGTGATGATAVLADSVAASPGGFAWHPDHRGAVAEQVAARFGAPPPAGRPNSARTTHAARVLVEHVLDELRPDFALFWSSEPDVSFHYAGIGDAQSLAALREADAALGAVLAWRDRQPDAAEIVILAVSDHGHVTGHARFDVTAAFAGAPLRVGRAAIPGIEAVLGAGGGPGLWLQGGDADQAASLAAWVSAQDWAGLVFSRHDVPGTVPLGVFGALHRRSPDLLVTFAGDDGPDHYGLPGRVLIDAADVPQGGGMHGGVQRGELATLFALSGGPVARGLRLPGPVDLSDIAPTVLALLGVTAEGSDGRAVTEAWTGAAPPAATRTVLPGAHGLGLAGWTAGGRFFPDAGIVLG